MLNVIAHHVPRPTAEALSSHGRRRDVIVVGASAGGIEALRRLFARLPGSLPAAIAVVVHMNPTSQSSLAALLARVTELTVTPASDNIEFQHGCVYVGVPDQHLVLRDARVRLTRDPKEHFHRPAVDALFRSAANAYGPRVAAVILSGSAFDGAAGAVAIRQAGGVVLAQDPAEALHPGMPRAAINRGIVDAVLPIDRLAATLRTLVAGEVARRAPSDTRVS